MFRDLLVHVTPDPAGRNRLDYAEAFARALGARLMQSSRTPVFMSH